MKLGIYGGTFNPPHLGHLTSARLALDALGLDELRFVPAALPPHKRLPPDALVGRRPAERWWSWPPMACPARPGERQRHGAPPARQEPYRRHPWRSSTPRTPARSCG